MIGNPASVKLAKWAGLGQKVNILGLAK